VSNKSTYLDYIKNHSEVPTLPDDNTRFKFIKKFISRCISHFTAAQNSFNNNLVNAIQELNNNLISIAQKQNNLEKYVAGLDNRQNDIVKSLEKIEKENISIHHKQMEIEKFVQSTFSDVDNRQNDIVKSLENINKDFQNISKRQDDITKNISEQISNIDNRQNDIVKSLENINKDLQNISKRQDDIINDFAKQVKQTDTRQTDIVKSFEKIEKENISIHQKQMEIEKFVQSTFSDVDNRQNLLVESLNDINNNIAALFKRAESSENGFNDLRSLYEQIIEQNNDIKNAFALAAKNSKKQKSVDNDILNNFIDDSLYSDYENSFRGSEKIIEKRLLFYINKIKNLKTTKNNFILDVGCGRGEFVKLLIKHNFHAKGIDINPFAVQQASQNNLPVEQADLFAFLNKLPKKSLPAVSAFHVIEHLHHNDLISFFRLAFDKIMSDGKLLIETPNMLNLFVAACDFYKDPTHIRPLHPATLQFYLREIGFKKVEVNFLHPFSEDECLKILKSNTAANYNFKKLNDLIFGARDCSIIAEK